VNLSTLLSKVCLKGASMAVEQEIRWRSEHAGTVICLKAKVALAAVKGEKALAEMPQQFEVQTSQMTFWRGHCWNGRQEFADRRATSSRRGRRSVQSTDAQLAAVEHAGE
jgi:hypothetical protein